MHYALVQKGWQGLRGGVPSNSRLVAMAAAVAGAAEALRPLTGEKQRLFDEFTYAAGGPESRAHGPPGYLSLHRCELGYDKLCLAPRFDSFKGYPD